MAPKLVKRNIVTMTIWNVDLDRYPGPRYRALAAAIAEHIENGTLAPGERLPTHRALAERLQVTVGTITRGYAEAERRGLVHARVGRGTYVRGSVAERAFRFSVPPHPTGTSTINFGLALPVPAQREHLLSDALNRLAADSLALRDALAYHPETGLPRHRKILVKWMSAWGTALNPDETIVCLGGMHGVYLALQALTRPGDLICSAGLTYPGVIGAARQLGLRHAPLPSDHDGITPDGLEALCHRNVPRLLYCIPNHNNPTMEAMPDERRRALLAVARRYDITIVEDDVHLVHESERPPNLVERDPRRVVYVSGCSKVLAAGLRVGLVRAAPDQISRIAASLGAQCWMVPPLNAEVACRWIESGAAKELARWQRSEIAARHALVQKVLNGCAFQTQPYGFSVWLRLPEHWRAAAFVQRCEERGVLLKSGEPFAVGGYATPQAVRLCISAPSTRNEVERGLLLVRETIGETPPSTAGTF